jgi:hypothetical protein
MKTLFFIVAAGILSLNAIEDLPNKIANKYCAEMKDGVLTVTNDGAAITSDITLANGAVIKTDGTVNMKDGSKIVLHEGDCVDADGIIMKGDPKDKTIKEPYKQ